MTQEGSRWLRLLHLVAICFAIGVSAGTCRKTTPQVYFSPEGGCSGAVVWAAQNAKNEIRVAMFALSRKVIVEALVEAKKRGVDVQVVLDAGQARNVQTGWIRLKDAGIPVRFSTSKGYLHHKFGVFDGYRVVTGSFNWTARGEKTNHENVVVLDDKEVASLYRQEWSRLPTSDAEPPRKPKDPKKPKPDVEDGLVETD